MENIFLIPVPVLLGVWDPGCVCTEGEGPDRMFKKVNGLSLKIGAAHLFLHILSYITGNAEGQFQYPRLWDWVFSSDLWRFLFPRPSPFPILVICFPCHHLHIQTNQDFIAPVPLNSKAVVIGPVPSCIMPWREDQRVFKVGFLAYQPYPELMGKWLDSYQRQVTSELFDLTGLFFIR